MEYLLKRRLEVIKPILLAFGFGKPRFQPLKKPAAVLLSLLCCAGVYAQSASTTAMDGDSLNAQINEFMRNVGNLIPDSVTQQNVWARAPTKYGSFGLGATVSATLYDQKSVGKILKGEGLSDFIGSKFDLNNLPSDIPFLPGGSVELRIGIPGIPLDVGISGMYLPEQISEYLGEGLLFKYLSVGGDIRFALIQDKHFAIPFTKIRSNNPAIPGLTLGVGYYFTSLEMGLYNGEVIATGNNWFAGDKYENYLNMQFISSTVVTSLQLSKDLWVITPYVGIKGIYCAKDAGYSWGTKNPVAFKGRNESFDGGLDYTSKGIKGASAWYFEVYGGMALFGQLLTIGVSYNVITEHVGLSASVRLGGGSSVF
jgi:hypothetical protein